MDLGYDLVFFISKVGVFSAKMSRPFMPSKNTPCSTSGWSGEAKSLLGLLSKVLVEELGRSMESKWTWHNLGKQLGIMSTLGKNWENIGNILGNPWFINCGGSLQIVTRLYMIRGDTN